MLHHSTILGVREYRALGCSVCHCSSIAVLRSCALSSTPTPFLPLGAASRSGKPRVKPCLSALRQLSRSGKPRVKPCLSALRQLSRSGKPRVKPYFIRGEHPRYPPKTLHRYQWSNLVLFPPSRPPRGEHPVSSFVFCRGCALHVGALCLFVCSAPFFVM